MRILFVSPSFPNRLHRIRAWQILDALCKTNDVHLVTFSWGIPPQSEKAELEKKCASVTVVQESKWFGRFRAILGIFTSLPLEVAYCYSPRMHRAVKSVIIEKNIEAVYVKRLRSAQFVLGTSLPTYIDSTDAMSMFYNRAADHAHFFQKLFYTVEGARYKKYEQFLSKHFSEWIVCSPVDAQYLTEQIPNIHTSVVPNGVDTEYFKKTDQSFSPNTLMISGLLNKFVNYEAVEYFTREIFPLILKEIPDAKLLLVGPCDHHVRNLADRSPQITVTGQVPDIRPYIAQAQIICCPVLTGAGTRNKILQAWAVGRPVISTRAGAEGLMCEANSDVLIADSPTEFAQSVIDLLNNPEKQESLVRNAHTRVEECYAMDTIEKTLADTLSKNLAKTHVQNPIIDSAIPQSTP